MDDAEALASPLELPAPMIGIKLGRRGRAYGPDAFFVFARLIGLPLAERFSAGRVARCTGYRQILRLLS